MMEQAETYRGTGRHIPSASTAFWATWMSVSWESLLRVSTAFRFGLLTLSSATVKGTACLHSNHPVERETTPLNWLHTGTRLWTEGHLAASIKAIPYYSRPDKSHKVHVSAGKPFCKLSHSHAILRTYSIATDIRRLDIALHRRLHTGLAGLPDAAHCHGYADPTAVSLDIQLAMNLITGLTARALCAVWWNMKWEHTGNMQAYLTAGSPYCSRCSSAL